MGIEESKEEFRPISVSALDELSMRAKDADYYEGRCAGMEYVIDSIVEAFTQES